MRKCFFISSFVLIFLTSCPIFPVGGANNSKRRGKLIKEYPDWCARYIDNGVKISHNASIGGCFGYSNWIDWQSEEGEKLHKFVDNNIVADDFNGKFRIILLGQQLSVCFSDSDSKHVDFFQYIGPYTDFYKDRLIDKDVNSDKVEYDCWFRKGNGLYEDFSDKCSDENSSKVLLKKIDDSKFNYSLTVGSEEIINVEMKNHLNKPKKANLPKRYSWFPTSEFREVAGKDYWSNDYYGKRKIKFSFDSEDNSVEIWKRGWVVDSFYYCFEGISLRSVDEENKKISFWLEDREQSDFADYFEIHITKENWTDEPKRGADKENWSLMKGTLGFYKEGNQTPICFYDEAHSEFSRRIGYDGCDE